MGGVEETTWNIGYKSNFEGSTREKKLNGDFPKDFKLYFDKAKKNGCENSMSFLYTFCMDDKAYDFLSKRMVSDETEIDEDISPNIVASYINFEYFYPYYVELHIMNNSNGTNEEAIRKVMEYIIKECSKCGKVSIIEEEKEIELKNVQNIETINMIVRL